MKSHFVSPPPGYFWEAYNASQTVSFELTAAIRQGPGDDALRGGISIGSDGSWNWASYKVIQGGRHAIPITGNEPTSVEASKALLEALGLPVAETICALEHGTVDEHWFKRSTVTKMLQSATIEQLDWIEDSMLRDREGTNQELKYAPRVLDVRVVCRLLNSLFKLDPVFVTALIDHRVPINQALADDETLPVVAFSPGEGQPLTMGVLGLLQGLVNSKIAAVYDDDQKTLVGFRPLLIDDIKFVEWKGDSAK